MDYNPYIDTEIEHFSKTKNHHIYLADDEKLMKSKLISKKKHLNHELKEHGFLPLSDEVHNNYELIIRKLSYSLAKVIDFDNIYPSELGTINIDWKNGDKIFALEIGKTSMGYFYEQDAKPAQIKEKFQLDKAGFRTMLFEVQNDLKTFLEI